MITEPEALDESTEAIVGKLLQICETCTGLSEEDRTYVALAAGRLREQRSNLHTLQNLEIGVTV